VDCFQSLIDILLTENEYENVAIDDGSSDKSLRIKAELAK